MRTERSKAETIDSEPGRSLGTSQVSVGVTSASRGRELDAGDWRLHSEVADGSAGPINDEQGKYLGIAFMNSTRAVDQLNSVGYLLPPFEHFSERVDVVALLCENVKLIKDRAQAHGTRVEKRFVGEPSSIMADKQQLSAAFFLMMSNILKAAQSPGRLIVEAFARKASQLTIRFADDNASLDPEQLSRMLGAASCRTEDDSELDLCLVRDVVRLHGCHFSLENKLG